MTDQNKPVRYNKKTGKPIGKPRGIPGKNSPVIGNNGLNLEDGDNTRFLATSLKLFNLPKIDIRDEQAVVQRLNEYFSIYAEADQKPTVAGMAMALGVDRHYLWAVAHDQAINGRGDRANLPDSVALFIKNAYKLLEELWETYMGSGKINPVSGIFLGKNNFGYQDKTEYVVTPNTGEDNYNLEEIRKRQIEAPSDSSDSADFD